MMGFLIIYKIFRVIMEWVSSMLKVLNISIHFLLTIVAWTSYLWLSWKYMALLSLMHICMLEINDGCFLSHCQFKDKDKENTKFYEWWFRKIGIKNYNRKKMDIFMRYYLPLILVLMGLFLQDVLGVIKPFV